VTEVALPRTAAGQQPNVLPFRLLTDGRLARLAADGDQRAFAAIYERHQQGIYRYCRSILRDHEDASDAVQATMMKALLAIPAKRPQVPLRAWLFRIAHNEAISVHRRRCRSEPGAGTGGGSGSSPGADELAAERRDLRELVDDLLVLPERQRTALVMRELSGLEYEEIAVVLGSTPAAAKQSVYDARMALHERRQGRETSCGRVRNALSVGDRRVLRGRRISAHLRICAGCRDFERTLDERPVELGALAPALPGLGLAAIVKALLGGGGGGGGGGASGSAVGLAGATGAVSAGTFNAAAAFTTLALASGIAVSDATSDSGEGLPPLAPVAAQERYIASSAFAGDYRRLSTHATLDRQTLDRVLSVGGGASAEAGAPPAIDPSPPGGAAEAGDASNAPSAQAPATNQTHEAAGPPAVAGDQKPEPAPTGLPVVVPATPMVPAVSLEPIASVPVSRAPAEPLPPITVVDATTISLPTDEARPGRGGGGRDHDDDRPGRGHDRGDTEIVADDHPGRGHGRGDTEIVADDHPGRGHGRGDSEGGVDDHPGRGHDRVGTEVAVEDEHPGRGHDRVDDPPRSAPGPDGQGANGDGPDRGPHHPPRSPVADEQAAVPSPPSPPAVGREAGSRGRASN
jgi:RNA polymerase sigma factor (sigma-70 family)